MQASPVREKVADVTYLRTSEGRFSVAAVIDLFARRVVGWSMSDQMVTEALLMAILRRGRLQELLRQSDQGGQYTGEPFQRLMADQGVTCSLSRSGNVWENAAMERLFSSPENRAGQAKTCRTRKQPRADMLDNIERFYNSPRRHPTIGYPSPMACEERPMKA